SGIAYVTAGSAGLEVVNVLPFDTKGVPPAVSLNAAALDNDPNTPGIQVAEGSFLPVPLTVTDDVQVRNVELLLNGQGVANEVSSPFDQPLAVPTIAQNGSSTATFQVRATDTGGNVALSNLVTLQLVPDTVPPAILDTNVPDGATRSSA